MKPTQLVLILIVLVVSSLGGMALWTFRPVAERKEVAAPRPPVQVIEAKRTTALLTLHSQGTVEARTLTEAASEVAGRVEWVAPNFESGGVFAANEVLLEIERTNYELALAQAESTLAEARVALEVERAKSEQAQRDWEKLRSDEKAGPLVLRAPQMESVQAQIHAAEAAVEKARRDLEKTQLRPPYAGRILATHTDFGSSVVIGSPMADFYATADLEVRLPLSLADHSRLDHSRLNETEVTFTAQIGNVTHHWKGTVVRQGAEIDRLSRSIHLIARIEDSHASSKADIVVPGLFVRATIEAKPLENVVSLPRRALREGDEVILVDDENRIFRQSVSVEFTGQDTVFVAGGLEVGQQVVISDLATVVDGMEVTVQQDQSTEPE